jgi:copper chaperone
MRKVVLSVPGISCEHCERVVSGALTPLQGVRSVKVNIPAAQVEVEYDEGTADVERMKRVLADEDYPVQTVREPGAGA